MECQECKSRPATLYFTQIINGNKSEVHVCDICAKEKGYFSLDEDSYSLHDLLKGLFETNSPHLKVKNKQHYISDEKIHCSKCNLSFQDFRRIGKFGCANCYQTFEDRLNPIFRRVHSGNTQHNGKIPQRRHEQLHHKRELDILRKELQYMVEHEEFEKAAVIRDKIKQLQNNDDGKDGEIL